MLRICPRTWPAVSDTTRLDPDPTQALLPSRDMVFSVKQDFLPSTVDGNFSGPQFLQIVGVYLTHTHTHTHTLQDTVWASVSPDCGCLSHTYTWPPMAMC